MQIQDQDQESCASPDGTPDGTPPVVPVTPTPPKRGRGGRPKNAPGTVRDVTIGVRVSASELIGITDKAKQMGLTGGQWLRESALSRRLPPPPVPTVNREQYANLARMAANLNQMAKLANCGQPVAVDAALLQCLSSEVGRLRLALIGAGGGDDS